MSQPPQGKSIWGTINTCVEIALDVYAIVAKDQDGKEQQGIMVKKSSAGELLSKKAVLNASLPLWQMGSQGWYPVWYKRQVAYLSGRCPLYNPGKMAA